MVLHAEDYVASFLTVHNLPPSKGIFSIIAGYLFREEKEKAALRRLRRQPTKTVLSLKGHFYKELISALSDNRELPIESEHYRPFPSTDGCYRPRPSSIQHLPHL
jgi:hypothetical protein